MAVQAELLKNRDFKEYVHKRLDEAGVPHHPPGPHGAAGCRVGDRLDWVFNTARNRVEPDQEIVEFMKSIMPIIDAHRDQSDLAPWVRWGWRIITRLK